MNLLDETYDIMFGEYIFKNCVLFIFLLFCGKQKDEIEQDWCHRIVIISIGLTGN
jgi:hypothetical protein